MDLPFTKSRFRIALECPTKLHYAAHPDTYPSTKADNEFLKSLAAAGFQVGELAKRMHPSGIEVTCRGHKAQLARTTALMQQNTVTIFEAAFRYGDLFIRADILRKHGNEVDLIEVKSKSASVGKQAGPAAKNGRAIRADWMPYVQDVTFQTYVLQHARPELRVRSLLMLPDPERVATVDGLHARFRIQRRNGRPEIEVARGTGTSELGSPLLVEEDVSSLVAIALEGNLVLPGLSDSWEDCVTELAAAWKMKRKLGPKIGAHCAKCEFRIGAGSALKRSGFVECWTEALNVTPEEVAGDTVLDLWDFRDKGRLIDERRWRLSDVNDDDLKLTPGKRKASHEGLSRGERQRMQAKGLPQDGPPFFFNRELVRRQMEQWRWPLHFIDFETTRPALPFHRGRRPYGLVAFQFSHHVLEADGRLRHAGEALLASSDSDPNIDFLRQLKTSLGATGTVLMWSNHERKVLEELRNEISTIKTLPDWAELQGFLGALLDGPRDLYDLAKLAEQVFFHPATKARSSLKVVLPALLGCSDWLRVRYASPIYGAPGGIPSRNFNGIAWWQVGAAGSVVDPYDLLGSISGDLHEIDNRNQTEDAIASGGAAAAAYARLQDEELEAGVRQAIECALKRYCELDTLAMAMVVQAWRDWCGFVDLPPLDAAGMSKVDTSRNHSFAGP